MAGPRTPVNAHANAVERGVRQTSAVLRGMSERITGAVAEYGDAPLNPGDVTAILRVVDRELDRTYGVTRSADGALGRVITSETARVRRERAQGMVSRVAGVLERHDPALLRAIRGEVNGTGSGEVTGDDAD